MSKSRKIAVAASFGMVWLLVAFCLLMPSSANAGTADRQEALRYLTLGTDAYAMGDIVQATRQWTQAVEFCRLTGDHDLEIEALGRRGEAYRALGHVDAAIADLSAALDQSQKRADGRQIAILSGALGNAYFHAHLLDAAAPLLAASYAFAQREHADFLPVSANNWGNYLTSVERDDEALEAYGSAISGAAGTALEGTALTNRARLLMLQRHFDDAVRDLERARQRLAGLPVTRDTALALTAIGRITIDLPRTAGSDSLHVGFEALSAAEAAGERLKDPRLQSLAQGYLGGLYEGAGRGGDALVLTDRAIFFAQTTGVDNDILYRWQWQRGRLLRAKGDMAGALAAYREAVADLATVRQDIPIEYNNGHSSFRETTGPLFFELADLLLRQAKTTRAAEGRRSLLVEAQQTVETLKTAEIKDYFHDACLALPQSEMAFTHLETHTAAIYPIMLPDRLELLVDLPDDIIQVTVPVDQRRLTQQIRDFRTLAEKRITLEYIVPARQLYDWIVRPIEDQLAAAKIDTIVFIPDGPLRTIPLAALFDGHRHLIERYAIATAPGLSLVQPKLPGQITGHALMAGLTVKVRDFPALPSVATELSTIGREVDATYLRDTDFNTDAIKRSLEEQPYSVVHIASHGVFKGDSQNSYLVTYDGKLKLDELADDIRIASLRERPLELLTLSACQTAAGDDRAALGLAGIAIKAGAQSAVATLWLINDAAAAEMMPAFYTALATPGMTKAKAMQKAQVTLLADSRFAHPSYWAAFMLIGNWQ